MRPVIVRDFTRILGVDQGYVPLPIRDEISECSVGGHTQCMTSEWDLSLDDIQRIIDGGRIRLTIQGSIHPPVLITITNPGEDLVP